MKGKQLSKHIGSIFLALLLVPTVAWSAKPIKIANIEALSGKCFRGL